MDSLRAMQVVVTLDKEYGGPSATTTQLSVALAGLDCRVSIWTTCASIADSRLQPAGIETREFPKERPSCWYHSPKMRRALRKTAAEYQLIHIQEVWSYPQCAAGRIASKTATPYLITPHGELDHRHLRHGGPLKQLKKRLYLKLIANRILRNAACLHALNTSEAEELIQAKFCKAVTVIPNGVHLAEFENLPAPEAAEERCPLLRDKRVVLFLSRLSPEKGLNQLIPAWKEIKSRSSFSDAILVLAGPDGRGYEAVVRNLIQEHDVENSVLLTGMVSGSEKLALMNRADVYVLPSYSEGFSMSVLENLAVGTPVLITPGCNFPEVVEAGAGMCVEPRVEEIEEGLRQLLDLTADQRKAMGKRGRALIADNYTWDVQARKMLNVYQCILKGQEIPLHPEPVEFPT